MKKHHFLILQGWPREIIKKIFFFFLLRILSKGTLMPTSHMMRQKKVTSRTVKTTCVYFSYHFLMDVNGTILKSLKKRKKLKGLLAKEKLLQLSFLLCVWTSRIRYSLEENWASGARGSKKGILEKKLYHFVVLKLRFYTIPLLS